MASPPPRSPRRSPAGPPPPTWRRPPPSWRRPPPARPDPCYVYQPQFLDDAARAELERWLATLHPLWEQRYSTKRPPPPGKEQRPLLRPVYWLGNWQFACLGYYEPPRRTADCAVRAEPFPPVLARLVAEIERRVRAQFPPRDVPERWHLNTCLVNFYGDRREGESWVDVARVGDHRDFEPGPVASLSLGERALFQFVQRGTRESPPVQNQWLEDGSLQIFGGPKWKDALLHRVQRVENKRKIAQGQAPPLGPAIEGFRTRRINFTFRYVPERDVTPFAELSAAARDDVREYMTELAARSPWFARELAAERAPRRR
jgi:alkylated DNA repair dioxygenase AlkB